jgi:hypothetical protein
MESFSFCVQKKQRLYRIQVDITYKSDNVIRFKIHAGTKWMLAEKWLFRKRNQWKLGNRNFTPDDDIKGNSAVMMDILRGIDQYLDPLKPRGPHYKNDFDIK